MWTRNYIFIRQIWRAQTGKLSTVQCAFAFTFNDSTIAFCTEVARRLFITQFLPALLVSTARFHQTVFIMTWHFIQLHRDVINFHVMLLESFCQHCWCQSNSNLSCGLKWWYSVFNIWYHLRALFMFSLLLLLYYQLCQCIQVMYLPICCGMQCVRRMSGSAPVK